MYILDKEKASKIMVDEEAHPSDKVKNLLDKYPEVDNLFQPAIEQWLEDRTIANTIVEGLSIQQVMDKQQVHFLVAVKKLNKLLDKEITPEKKKTLLEILSQQVYFE